ELPMGEDGEIAASGPQVMLGYWNKPEANEESFRTIGGKRYLLTGDIGHFDEDHFLVITDRKKDMIIVGGFNAYPKEIEEVLYTHPKVALAAVVGVPDPRAGESIKAFIQLKPGVQATEEEFLEFCKDKLAGYKRPREIEFRDSLPTSVVGKVLRRVLKEEEIKKRKQGNPGMSHEAR
ncbi:MAG TPA: long-chain fatty acid--CoA ligase, partial [Desulfobacteraceae bacterium]|nr:long-chain fatty acid--CoA ligase [Desulfobacteraceae bacterium]